MLAKEDALSRLCVINTVLGVTLNQAIDVDRLKFLKEQFFGLSRLFYQETVKHQNSVQKS